MHTNRLLRLAVLLEEDAINPQGVKFDLELWGTDSRTGNLHPANTIIPADCQTTACAMGLAAISGIFYDEGLTWNVHHGWLVPTFNGEDGFDAALAFFELPDLRAVYHLFSPESYDQHKGKDAELAVAKRIRKLVAGGPAIDPELLQKWVEFAQ